MTAQVSPQCVYVPVCVREANGDGSEALMINNMRGVNNSRSAKGKEPGSRGGGIERANKCGSTCCDICLYKC